jgi:hypothetical protein
MSVYNPAADLDDGSYRPANLGQLLRRTDLGQLPKVEELVEGVVSTPAAVVLVGSYGTGKTVLVHGIACCVATGQPWLGREVAQRRVLVVVGEGAYGLEARIAGWEYTWNHGNPIPHNAVTFAIKPDSLSKRNTWQALIDFAANGGYGLVILDTFSSLAYDADETKDAASIMRWLSDLSAAINGTAILVHHPGWSDNSRTRGGYQFEANADEVLVLTGVAEGSGLVSLTRKKAKDGIAGKTLWLNRRPAGDTVVMEHARATDLDVPLRQRILAALGGYGAVGGTGPQLIEECGLDPKKRSGFYAAIAKLCDECLVVRAGVRARARYYLAEHAPEVTNGR